MTKLLGERPDRGQRRQVQPTHLESGAGCGLPDPRGAFSPASVLRTASTTFAPCRASSVAVTNPSPEFAPVTTANANLSTFSENSVVNGNLGLEIPLDE